MSNIKKEDIIMAQPKSQKLKGEDEFQFADNYDEFIAKNGINNCYEIKTMFHQCMDQKKKFSLCDYYYSMLFLCGMLEEDKLRN